MDWKIDPKDSESAFKQLKRIQTLALTAIFSDDDLMDRLVLKGGTAVDLIHGVGNRASIDLDFSMEGDFDDQEKKELGERLERLLDTMFRPEGLVVFDVTFQQKPKTLSVDLDQFWGGYKLEFKLIEITVGEALSWDKDRMRRQSLTVGPGQTRKFEVEISRYEYCADKEPKDVNGFNIYVYRPRLIVCEKLRAICQQMTEYRAIILSKHSTPRSRDFFDIYNVVHLLVPDVKSLDFFNIVKFVFDAKRVPLEFLGKIRDTKSFHAPDFDLVRNTVPAGTEVSSFDVYFNFVVELVDGLKPFWDVELPAL